MLLNLTIRRPLSAVLGALVVTAFATGAPAHASSPPPGSTADRPVVVATISIWADIVDQLDCTDTFDVHTLIPRGGDAHAYEPSMRDRQTLDDAALVVANGAGLEAFLTDMLGAVADDGTPVYEAGDHITTHAMDAGGVSETSDPGEHHDDHDHEGDDPHVWFDPTLVVAALPSLADALVAAGADATAMQGCVDDLTAALGRLDDDITNTLAAVPADRRILVTNHDALGYLARHYDFEILGSVLPSTSTLVEASPAELERLADQIRAAGVPAIFAEALETTDDATALADRLGVAVVTLYTDSLGDADSGADTYQAMLMFDAAAIADALGG